MPNPLEVGGPPVAPRQDAPDQNQQPMQPPGGAPQQQAPPPPTHAQTMAALRHFHAIEDELKPILEDPQLGKSSVKSKIVDGVTKLVANKIITPAQAVMQLASVPDDPLQQRKWATDQMVTTMHAQDTILHHHAQGGPEDPAAMTSNPDDHLQAMDSVMSNYAKKNA